MTQSGPDRHTVRLNRLFTQPNDTSFSCVPDYGASMASSDWSPSGRYLLGLVVGVVVGGAGCFLILIAIAGYLLMIMNRFGLDERANVEAQRNILLGTYAAWFAGLTFIGLRAEKGPFLSGFLASLPAAAVWLFIAWQAHGLPFERPFVCCWPWLTSAQSATMSPRETRPDLGYVGCRGQPLTHCRRDPRQPPSVRW